jgi:hypothetical protein
VELFIVGVDVIKVDEYIGRRIVGRRIVGRRIGRSTDRRSMRW